MLINPFFSATLLPLRLFLRWKGEIKENLQKEREEIEKLWRCPWAVTNKGYNFPSLSWYKGADFDGNEKGKEWETKWERMWTSRRRNMSQRTSLAFLLGQYSHVNHRPGFLGFLDLTSPIKFPKNYLRRQGSDSQVFLLKKPDDFLRKLLSF